VSWRFSSRNRAVTMISSRFAPCCCANAGAAPRSASVASARAIGLSVGRCVIIALLTGVPAGPPAPLQLLQKSIRTNWFDIILGGRQFFCQQYSHICDVVFEQHLGACAGGREGGGGFSAGGADRPACRCRARLPASARASRPAATAAARALRGRRRASARRERAGGAGSPVRRPGRRSATLPRAPGA